jgi:hypothetical protein
VDATVTERAAEVPGVLGPAAQAERFDLGWAGRRGCSPVLSSPSGCRSCGRHTDRANPTSNAIYQKIGYRPLCDSRHYRF